jgi:hypothetical protein
MAGGGGDAIDSKTSLQRAARLVGAGGGDTISRPSNTRGVEDKPVTPIIPSRGESRLEGGE